MREEGLKINLKTNLVEVGMAWKYAARQSGDYVKYARIWNDPEKQKALIKNITLNQFDVIMHEYGHTILMCLLDYYVSVEEYVKCAAIVTQVRAHNNISGDNLPTRNTKKR